MAWMCNVFHSDLYTNSIRTENKRRIKKLLFLLQKLSTKIEQGEKEIHGIIVNCL